MQANWIGKSKGAFFDFKLEVSSPCRAMCRPPPLQSGAPLRVFTTRPETLAGVSFLAVSPEHVLASQPLTSRPRASHPLTGALLPVYSADYVISDYGTQAVMGGGTTPTSRHMTSCDTPILQVFRLMMRETGSLLSHMTFQYARSLKMTV